MKNTNTQKILIFIFIFVYSVTGLYTEYRLIFQKPLPEFSLEDYRYYEKALKDAQEIGTPYSLREIGRGYLYPPQTLLYIELYKIIPILPLKYSIYTSVNIVLLLLIVYGISKEYGYTTDQILFWYPLSFLFGPYLELIHIGQINILTLFGIFLLFIYCDRFQFLGGLGISLAILTKVSPIFLFPYVFIKKRWSIFYYFVIIVTITTIFVLCIYGKKPLIEYPFVFSWLMSQFPVGWNSQSLIAKIIDIKDILLNILPIYETQISYYFSLLSNHKQLIQRIISLYFLWLISISFIFSLISNNEEWEPLFIVSMIGMTLSPNVLWYHHYVFLLLPILIWMGWSKLNWKVITWCLLFLLTIQIERWLPPYGLITHLWGHASIILLLIYQFRKRKFLQNSN